MNSCCDQCWDQKRGRCVWEDCPCHGVEGDFDEEDAA